MAFNTYAVSRGCSYRKVFSAIQKLADGKLKEMYPELTRIQRIILAQKEPLFTACKELRQPTIKEIQEAFDEINEHRIERKGENDD